MGHHIQSGATTNADFTEARYRQILELVEKTKRVSVPYDGIPWGGNYLLWRHDIDFSINRSFRLAALNTQYSLHSTFFVNIHSTFYNAFEPRQAKLLRAITAMGHDLGVHFDWDFYGEICEGKFEKYIAQEASLLADLGGKPPVAVSFHNPSEAMLELDSESLGGLVNAYSGRLMNDASYCSDSNGYWRYGELADVVANEKIQRVHVLTHPGWWLQSSVAPRERVHRAAFGRAVATMDDYDGVLRDTGRKNFGAFEDALGLEPHSIFQVPPFWQQLLSEHRVGLLFMEIWIGLFALMDNVALAGVLQVSSRRTGERGAGPNFEVSKIRSRVREAFLEEFREDLSQSGEDLNLALYRLRVLAEDLFDGREDCGRVEMLSACSTLIRLLARISSLGLNSGLLTPEQVESIILHSSKSTDYPRRVDSATGEGLLGSPVGTDARWKALAARVWVT